MISKELLSEVLKKEYNHIEQYCNVICCRNMINEELHDGWDINIYELAHKNLKQWAKLKNIFDIIDWSEEPEQIFKKAEELRNEIN